MITSQGDIMSLIDCHKTGPLTYATGCFVVISFPSTTDVCSCVNTPSHLYLLASVNTVYGLEVLEYLRIGAETSVSFSI